MPSVFISYSHKDERWKNRFLPQLKALELAGRLEVWDDRRIDAGEQWYDEIKAAMDRAAVAVCLISDNYLASQFCVKEEVPYLLERRQRDRLHLIPVLLEPCPWKQFAWIEQSQLLPRDGKSVTVEFRGREKKVFAEIAESVLRKLDVSVADVIPVKSSPWPRPKKVDLSRLPVTGDGLFGRQRELVLLDRCWHEGLIGAVSLIAWGGVGKSMLVNKWLDQLALDNYRGAHHVFAWSFFSQGSAERVTAADEFLYNALSWFGDPDPRSGSAWDKGARLARLVRAHRSLVILDGLEPLQSVGGGVTDPAISTFVQALAAGGPSMCVITTRRQVAELEPYPATTASVDLELISPEAGRALLRVGGIRGSDIELEQLTKDFGQHALAIGLLSTYLRNRPLALAARMPDVDVPVSEGRFPRRVMAAFESELRGTPDLDLLHIIGLFDRPADGATLRAIREPPSIPGLTSNLQQLGDHEWRELLSRVRGLRLLAAENRLDPLSVDAHPLVRQHFGEQLQQEAPEAWRAGNERIYEHLSRTSQEFPETLEEMVPLFQAVRHGCAAGRHVEAWREVFRRRIQRGWDFYGTRKLRAWGAHLTALTYFFERQWTRPVEALGPPDRAFTMYQAGVYLRALGRIPEALAPLQGALKESLFQLDWAGAAVAASNLSEVELLSGDLSAALEHAREAVELADRSGKAFQRSGKRSTLADVLHHVGMFTEARRLFAESESITRDDGTPEPMPMFARYRWCDLLLTLKEYEQAATASREALAGALAGNHPLDIALDRMNLGLALLRMAPSNHGDMTEARVLVEEALMGLREAGNLDLLPRGLLARAECLRDEGILDAALEHIDEALATARKCSMPLHEIDAQLARAAVLVRAGQISEAAQTAASAAAVAKRLGYRRRDGRFAPT